MVEIGAFCYTAWGRVQLSKENTAMVALAWMLHVFKRDLTSVPGCNADWRQCRRWASGCSCGRDRVHACLPPARGQAAAGAHSRLNFFSRDLSVLHQHCQLATSSPDSGKANSTAKHPICHEQTFCGDQEPTEASSRFICWALDHEGRRSRSHNRSGRLGLIR